MFSMLFERQVDPFPVRVIEQMFTVTSSAEEQAQMDRLLEEIDGKDCPKETKRRAEDQAPARTATTTDQRAEDQ
eukprot:7392337-Pyramimonas_sp.AAC.1